MDSTEELSKFYPITYRTDLLDGYMVNKLGQLKMPEGRILKGTKAMSGYKTYCVRKKDGSRTTVRAHKLVSNQFLNCSGEKLEPNHIDEDKMNPRLDNLEMVSHKANMNHGTCQERRKDSRELAINEYTIDGKYIRTWKSAYHIGYYCCDYNIKDIKSKTAKNVARGITKCCMGETYVSHGKIWRYYDGSNDKDLEQRPKMAANWNFPKNKIWDFEDVPNEYLYHRHTTKDLLEYFINFERFTKNDVVLFNELLSSIGINKDLSNEKP